MNPHPITEFYKPLPQGITQTPVSFMSDGLKIAGILYRPAGVQPGVRRPAVVVNGPASAVKEQAPAIYARNLVNSGYITLIFDHRNWGESEGMPRQEHDPQGSVSDIKSAVSYLETRDDVDADRIGVTGICVGAGYAMAAAATDPRITALALVAGVYGWARTNEASFGQEWMRSYLIEVNEHVAQQEQSGETQHLTAVGPEGSTEPLASPSPDAYSYYGSPERSYSPYWQNRFTWNSIAKMMSYDARPFAGLLSTPTIVVHGLTDPFTTPDMAREVYDHPRGPKKLELIENKTHTSFYEGAPIGPACQAIAEWFDARHPEWSFS